MIGYIYKITNKINGKIYIGQTIHLNRRFNKYRGLRCKGQPKLYRALVKYGIDSFTLEQFDTAPEEQLDDLEIKYIAQFDSFMNGYNCTTGGKRCIISEATKVKMSDSHKGTRNHNFGKHLSDEQKQKLSLAKRGALNPNFGRPIFAGKTHSEEARRKMSEAVRRYNHNKGMQALISCTTPSSEVSSATVESHLIAAS